MLAAIAAIIIQAGPLPQALDSLQRQTQISIVFDPVKLRSVHSNAVECRCSPLAALTQMLAGTRVWIDQIDNGAYSLSVDPQIVPEPRRPYITLPRANWR